MRYVQFRISKSAVLFCTFTCCLLAACSVGSAHPSVNTSLPLEQFMPAKPTVDPDTFFVDVWVDNHTPSQDEKVILFGMLNKNGVFLNGITMQATWPDSDNPRGMPNCFVQLSYGRGVCVIDASKYPSGQYVPIQIKFEYQDQVFTGETGFTPK